MIRERALKAVLVLVGLLFSAGVYPLTMFLSREPASLIAFTAWSSFAHAAVMAVQAYQKMIERGELLGVAALVVIGVALIALAPAKELVARTSAVAV